jgi:hypothetical protein
MDKAEDAVTFTGEIRTLHGACYCRAVTFTVLDAFEYALFCHCGECRRRTGAASKPFAGAPASTFKVTRGEDVILRFGEGDGHHASCAKCGSLLYSLVREGAYVHVTLGTLIDAPTITPSAHIFVNSKAPWDVICDNLPQFEAFPTR